MEQSLSDQQSVKVRLEHSLTPHQLQSLDILAAPQMELEAKIAAEQETNPLIEVMSPDEQEGEEQIREHDEDSDELTPGDDYGSLDENRDDFSESLERSLESGEEFFTASNDPDADERRQFQFDSIVSEKSMQEQLMEQLHLSDIPKRLIPVAEGIIGSIGDSGYFESVPAEIAQVCSCTEQDVLDALKIVQTFDPPGIAARDLKECLLLQIERMPELYPDSLKELIENHLEDVARNRMPQIAKDMNISQEQLNGLLVLLKKLDPHPGASVSPDGISYVRPEATVVQDPDTGEYRLQPERDTIPRLKISQHYLAMLDDPDTPEDAKNYIREKVASAKQLMNSLDQRKSTVERIGALVVSAQQDYFSQGPEALKPMTMREIADKLGRDESTVSRAIANKYLNTPRGIVPFRDFFSGGFRSEGGEEVSSHGIKEIIRDAVSKEDPASPLSDSKIESILKERGFSVARRTVAKYREELGIPSSQLRKVFS